MNFYRFSALETSRRLSEFNTNENSQDCTKIMKVYESSVYLKMFTILGYVDPNFMTKWIG